MTVSDHFREHVELLEKLADAGDEIAAKSLASIILLCEGWRYGDPDPADDDGPDDDGGGEPLPCNVIEFRRAA